MDAQNYKNVPPQISDFVKFENPLKSIIESAKFCFIFLLFNKSSKHAGVLGNEGQVFKNNGKFRKKTETLVKLLIFNGQNKP